MSHFSLDQIFVHSTSTHEFRICWTQIGASKASSPTLVFIHGTPWSSVEWQDLAANLSTRYNIYLYDHPGFGDSPAPRRLAGTDSDNTDLDPSLRLRAEASAALFKHWELDNAPHVIAHDNGGLVSLRLLLQHDIKYASLCLIDVVAISRPAAIPFFKLVAENESVFGAIPPQFLEGLIRAYVKDASYKPMSAEVEDMLTAPWLVNGSQGCERFLQEMVQAHNRSTTDVEEKYERVGSQTPTKIIWGKDDAWIPHETAYKLQKAVNAAEVVIVEEAGHLIQFDLPSRLALEVGLWLNKNSADS